MPRRLLCAHMIRPFLADEVVQTALCRTGAPCGLRSTDGGLRDWPLQALRRLCIGGASDCRSATALARRLARRARVGAPRRWPCGHCTSSAGPIAGPSNSSSTAVHHSTLCHGITKRDYTLAHRHGAWPAIKRGVQSSGHWGPGGSQVCLLQGNADHIQGGRSGVAGWSRPRGLRRWQWVKAVSKGRWARQVGGAAKAGAGLGGGQAVAPATARACVDRRSAQQGWVAA